MNEFSLIYDLGRVLRAMSDEPLRVLVIDPPIVVWTTPTGSPTALRHTG